MPCQPATAHPTGGGAAAGYEVLFRDFRRYPGPLVFPGPGVYEVRCTVWLGDESFESLPARVELAHPSDSTSAPALIAENQELVDLIVRSVHDGALATRESTPTVLRAAGGLRELAGRVEDPAFRRLVLHLDALSRYEVALAIGGSDRAKAEVDLTRLLRDADTVTTDLTNLSLARIHLGREEFGKAREFLQQVTESGTQKDWLAREVAKRTRERRNAVVRKFAPWGGASALTLGVVLFGRAYIRRSTRNKRKREQRCVGCGYDLRATPGRCPECGTEPAPVAPAPPPARLSSPKSAPGNPARAEKEPQPPPPARAA